MNKPLPTPDFFEPEKVSRVWRVQYETRAKQARKWASDHDISPAGYPSAGYPSAGYPSAGYPSTGQDDFRAALVAVDVQNTFCIPEFELFVGGRSGNGAVEDNVRLCRFIYHNLNRITRIVLTLDTHTAVQIFHAVFLVDRHGNHPSPLTIVSAEDIRAGRWKFNPALATPLGIDAAKGQSHLAHYVNELHSQAKYELTIWPYHAMLGGIGHALVSAFEEAVFFHNIARYSPPDFIIKGNNPFTEHYSAVGPEVVTNSEGQTIAQKNSKFLQIVRDFDAVIIAGQAKSHCVAWTVNDLLQEIRTTDPRLAQKIFLLEDCTSPVVVPGIVDFTEQADLAYARFEEAGMHRVQSTIPIDDWPIRPN